MSRRPVTDAGEQRYRADPAEQILRFRGTAELGDRGDQRRKACAVPGRACRRLPIPPPAGLVPEGYEGLVRQTRITRIRRNALLAAWRPGTRLPAGGQGAESQGEPAQASLRNSIYARTHYSKFLPRT